VHFPEVLLRNNFHFDGTAFMILELAVLKTHDLATVRRVLLNVDGSISRFESSLNSWE
jgi:hypothetical protein